MIVLVCKLGPGLESIRKIRATTLCPSENGYSPELSKVTVHRLKIPIIHKKLSHPCGCNGKQLLVTLINNELPHHMCIGPSENVLVNFHTKFITLSVVI